MTKPPVDQKYSKIEVDRRRAAILAHMGRMPPTPPEDMPKTREKK
jgi:hypothetical protein